MGGPRELSQRAGEIMNIPLQAFSVIIKENRADNIGLGGELLSDRK